MRIGLKECRSRFSYGSVVNLHLSISCTQCEPREIEHQTIRVCEGLTPGEIRSTEEDLDDKAGWLERDVCVLDRSMKRRRALDGRFRSLRLGADEVLVSCD